MDNNNRVSRPSREGEANPMYGRSQSKQTRDEKIHHTTMDEFLRGESFQKRVAEILREELLKVANRTIVIPL